MTLSRIAILGANGQIGRALVAELGSRAIALTRTEADFTKPETLAARLDALQPTAVINAAAYTAVDTAEDEPDTAHIINTAAPAALAAWCAQNHVPFVHYSTDYVFDGTGDVPWMEDSPVAPLNVYGQSKYASEQAIVAAGGRFLIFRTSWVYDAVGRNFFNTMLRLGEEHEKLTVVADQYGAPSYAPHLATATLQALEYACKVETFPSGIYHMVNAGETTWHGFATAIFDGARAEGLCVHVKTVEPVRASAYPTRAKRPSNSRLNTTKLSQMLHVTLPPWEHGLRAALKEKTHAGHRNTARGRTAD